MSLNGASLDHKLREWSFVELGEVPAVVVVILELLYIH